MAACRACAGEAQTSRLGILAGRPRNADVFEAFFDELRLFGFAEVLPDGFGLRNEQFPKIATATVNAAPNVIIPIGDPAARIVQDTTRTIPIVAISDDMIAAGLVRSLARPDGNITGVSLLATELDGKRLEILMQAVPGAHRIATLSDAGSDPRKFQTLQDAVHSRGVELTNYAVSSSEGIAPAIDAAKSWGATALNVLATPLFSVNRRIVIDRANATRLPTIFQWPDMAEDGGLIGYGLFAAAAETGHRLAALRTFEFLQVWIAASQTATGQSYQECNGTGRSESAAAAEPKI
jgi:ABC transporter substrate binding protein